MLAFVYEGSLDLAKLKNEQQKAVSPSWKTSWLLLLEALLGTQPLFRRLMKFWLRAVPAGSLGKIPLLIKEVVGIHVLQTRSLSGGGIPPRLLLRVSLAKPTFALLRF